MSDFDRVAFRVMVLTEIKKHCEPTDLVEDTLYELAEVVYDEASKQTRDDLRQVSVIHDADEGWIVTRPENGEMIHDLPESPSTKKMAIRMGREAAHELGLPLYVYKRDGTLKRVEVPKSTPAKNPE